MLVAMLNTPICLSKAIYYFKAREAADDVVNVDQSNALNLPISYTRQVKASRPLIINSLLLVVLIISCYLMKDRVFIYFAINGFEVTTKTLTTIGFNGVDVNLRDNYGKTALIIAKEKGYSDMIELLKTAGAKE